jgi:hypothetical protein
MSINDISEEDREVLRDALQAMRGLGDERPLIPIEVDLTGDGIHDAFGLGPDGELVVVAGVKLEETGYVSEGDDWTEEG